MRLLLDTHALLWALGDSARLATTAAEAIVDPDNDVLVSAASCWEISIKEELGKLRLPAPASQWLLQAIEQVGFETVDISPYHCLTAGSLPVHHRDPFDRLLIAQGMAESLTIMTRDERFHLYDVSVLAA